MKKLNKTLLILLCAGSISMAGCGNSAAVSKDSTAAIETVDEEKAGTAAPETAGSGEAGDSETAIADASDASESSILIADASVSYLGPAGTYTEEAAMFFFPEAKTMMPKGTVDEAIDSAGEYTWRCCNKLCGCADQTERCLCDRRGHSPDQPDSDGSARSHNRRYQDSLFPRAGNQAERNMAQGTSSGCGHRREGEHCSCS